MGKPSTKPFALLFALLLSAICLTAHSRAHAITTANSHKTTAATAAERTKTTDYIVERYDKTDGLPSNTVYSSFKDDDGFVWFATWHGLCSFDGQKDTPFTNRTNSRSEIPPRKVRDLVEDSEGNLWIRNADGRLYVFDRRKEIFHDISEDLKAVSNSVLVTRIQKPSATTADGATPGVLLATKNRDIYRVCLLAPSGKIDIRRSKDASMLSKGAQRQTYTDSHGVRWTTTDYRTLSSTASAQPYALSADSLFEEIKFVDAGTNGLFILLRNGEIWRYDHSRRQMDTSFAADIKRETTPLANSVPRFYDITLDSDSILWLSSTNDGVYKVSFPRHDFRFLFTDIINIAPLAHLKNNGVRAVYQTCEGDIWIGTRNGDLYCINKERRLIRQYDREEIGVVYHIMEDRRHNLWFSTKGSGLVKATNDPTAPQGLRLTRYTNNSADRYSLSSNKVYYTFEDSKGRIWVCTFSDGINLLQEPSANGQKGKSGRPRFINKYNRFTNYPGYELYTDVRGMTEDGDGRLWVGTTDGLMSFDGNFKKPESIDFETYRNQPSGITDNDVFTLYKDRQGDIWIGIFGSGLNKLEAYDSEHHMPVLKPYTLSERLGGDVITSIVEDGEGCLWVCTENGLSSLRRGAAFTNSYDRFAGFPAVTIEDNTSVCLLDGHVAVGCREGLLSFNPKTVLHNNESRHTTYIMSLRIANRDIQDYDPPLVSQSLKYTDRIQLAHNQATFTIEFASPQFTGASTPYIYILEGYDQEWHTGGDSRYAGYANVPAGHYRLRVKVNDNNSSERILDIVITPAWWASWWAYTIYGLLFLAIAYSVFRLVQYTIRMRNEVYINNRLAELKIRFFTNVSHELRTPLSLIKGPIAELIATERLTPSGREYLALIDRNARKMLQLVNQILDFRKVQNGKMKLHVSYVDLNAIIEMLMQEFRFMADERDIAFVFDKPEEHVFLWCDAEKIGVVLNNLINNAFKYTDEGGRICVVLEHDYDRRLCTIRVEDNGVEIPKSQLEQIFERFSQANNRTLDDNATGTGIGLSLSREYVHMHHGRIYADNLPGSGGVVFTIEMPTERERFVQDDIEEYLSDTDSLQSPLADSPVAAIATGDNTTEIAEFTEGDSATHTAAEGDGEKVLAEAATATLLLIEDNADLCRMLQLQLGKEFNVVTAHDGVDGLKKVYQHHPDLIITDLMMPLKGGMDVLRTVKQDFKVCHIPVIVLTAKNTEEDQMRAIKTGANAFITKPFSGEYLVVRINQLLSEQRNFQRKMVMRSAISADTTTKDEYERNLVKKDVEFLARIKDIIERNLNANDFNIDTIAETVGLSRSVFFKKVKSLTGLAPVDLVKEIRLTKAARRIATTDDPITEIAYAVGFRDAGYFGKCFRKKYEMTPKEYRASRLNG